MSKYAKQERLEQLQQADHDDLHRANRSTLPKSAVDLKAGAREGSTLLLEEELERASSLLRAAEAEEEHEQGELHAAVEAAIQAKDDGARPSGGQPDGEQRNTPDDQPTAAGAFDARWLVNPVGMSMALWMNAGQRYWEWLNSNREKALDALTTR